MATLEKQLEKAEAERRDVLERIDKRNSRRRIPCASCDDAHRVKDLEAIQTHWYVEPHGCTGGNYWLQSEMEFKCPETGVYNRLLFSNFDVPWDERKQFANDPEAQFKRAYRGLFKSVEDVYERSHEKGKRPWVNNLYVDNHRAEFGLVERREQSD